MQDPHSFVSSFMGTRGYASYDPVNEVIVVTIRGSKNPQNWIENLDFIFTSYDKCENCKVHSGFYNAYNSLKDDLLDNVRNLYQKYQKDIFISGHSLGGAMVPFAALDITE